MRLHWKLPAVSATCQQLSRSLTQFSATIYRFDFQRAPSAADGSVHRMPADAALHCQWEVGIEMSVDAFEIDICIQIGGQFHFDTAIDGLELQIARPFRTPYASINGAVHAAGSSPAIGRHTDAAIHTGCLDVAAHRFGMHFSVDAFSGKPQVSRHADRELNLGVVVAVSEMGVGFAVLRVEEAWIKSANLYSVI